MTLIDGTRTACSTAHKDQPLSVTTRQSSPQGVAASLPSPPSPIAIAAACVLERSGGLQISVPQGRRRRRGHAFLRRLVHVLDDGVRLSRCVQDGGRSIRPPATSIRSIKLFKSNQRLFLWPDGGSRSWGGEFRHFVLIIIGAGFSCLAISLAQG